MKLIVGLGNPGKEYELTRHNAGFLLLDGFAQKYKVQLKKESRFNALCGATVINGQKILLLKPQTYMNLSGTAVTAVKNFYKLSLPDLLILHDDLDLPFGELRYREKGSAAGHNGLKSIIENLSTQEFARLKIGIGRPVDPQEITNYVLGKFDKIALAEFKQKLIPEKGIIKIEKWLEVKHV